jgi:hypothetical protein
MNFHNTNVGLVYDHSGNRMDVFDYPLTSAEIHRYLVGLRATRNEVEQVLSKIQSLSQINRYFTLQDREALTDLRRKRERIAAELWPQASGYGRTIASLPFIRMVAVTGSRHEEWMKGADRLPDRREPGGCGFVEPWFYSLGVWLPFEASIYVQTT